MSSMNGLCYMHESRVIDEEMLAKAVKEQGPQEQAGFIAHKEGLKYDEVTQLCLNYRNIVKIEHVWQFTSVTRLQLDNNRITKIEGLEGLTNLVMLDLSFNRIKVIEGLETLVKLQDLLLSSNHISVIESMDALQNLQIFLIGNNFISNLDNVIYLRKFKNLRAFELAGNPVSKDKNYKVFVAAHLPGLVYLDYRLMDKQTRKKAQYQYQNATALIKCQELQEEKDTAAQKSTEEELQLHMAAFVEHLNGPHLFDSMFADDVKGANLTRLPGAATPLESYRTQFEALCMQIFEAGLTHHTQRQNEVECFFTSFQKVIADNQQGGAQIVADFEKSRRRAMAEMQQAAQPSVLKDRIRNDLVQIHETLLNRELQLVAQLEDIILEVERNITEMVGEFVEYVQGIFTQCRNLENQYHENMLNIAMETLETVAKNQLEEDLPADLQLLFVDKDTINNAVETLHCTHLEKIDCREDQLLTGLNGWKSALMKSIHEDEAKRNRNRVSEIRTYVDFAREQL